MTTGRINQVSHKNAPLLRKAATRICFHNRVYLKTRERFLPFTAENRFIVDSQSDRAENFCNASSNDWPLPVKSTTHWEPWFLHHDSPAICGNTLRQTYLYKLPILLGFAHPQRLIANEPPSARTRRDAFTRRFFISHFSIVAETYTSFRLSLYVGESYSYPLPLVAHTLTSCAET